jgi:hypothetical protein
MPEQIKLIWDFRGPNAKPIAEHHSKHLSEFAEAEKLKNTRSGTEHIEGMHHIAFLIVDKEHMDLLRDRLKPNRGQNYLPK